MRELPGCEVVKWTLSRCGTYIRSLVDDWMYAPSCSCRGGYSTVRGGRGGGEDATRSHRDRASRSTFRRSLPGQVSRLCAR